MCVSDTRELNSVLHTVTTVLPGAVLRLMSRILQQFLAVSTKDAYYLPKFGIFPMVVGYSFFRVVAAFAWCSSRLKGFLVGVFWMCVLFLLPQLGLFLIECLCRMTSKHKPACLALLKVKACLNSSGARL